MTSTERCRDAQHGECNCSRVAELPAVARSIAGCGTDASVTSIKTYSNFRYLSHEIPPPKQQLLLLAVRLLAHHEANQCTSRPHAARTST
jgi:hypothetical protein